MDITKLLLIGGAAWIGYGLLKPQAVAAPAAGGILPANTPAPSNTAASTLALLKSEEEKNGFTIGSVDQHNYYYAKVRGVAPASPEDWGIGPELRGRQMNVSEYWALASSNGLSGMRGVGYVRAPRLAIMEAE